KFNLPGKTSGIFAHGIAYRKTKSVRGFDDVFYAPHSRYTSVSREEIQQHPEILLLSDGDAGPFIILSKDGKNVMVTGHLEYDTTTIAEEYERDLNKGIDIDPPVNYFPNNAHTKKPITTWRSHSHLLFSNSLNYYVYQETPYEYDW